MLGEACVREALRIVPSVPAIARRAEQDLEICGYKVPKVQTTVTACLAVALTPCQRQNLPCWAVHAVLAGCRRTQRSGPEASLQLMSCWHTLQDHPALLPLWPYKTPLQE